MTPSQPHRAPSFAPGELAAKALRQCAQAIDTKRQFFEENAQRIEQCAVAMARAFDHGARLYVMGNGGSACDAQHMAVECMHPIIQNRPALPAVALTTDTSILTAVGNDQDFSMAFVQQLRTLARAGDLAMGISTSGQSRNLVRALQTAKEMGMTTIAFAGRDGGRMRDMCDWCFVVASFSIPRIQETHETLLHVLWDLIHIVRGEEDVL